MAKKEDGGNRHERACVPCGGSGKIRQPLKDNKTGTITWHTVTCYGCGGTGKA